MIEVECSLLGKKVISNKDYSSFSDIENEFFLGN